MQNLMQNLSQTPVYQTSFYLVSQIYNFFLTFPPEIKRYFVSPIQQNMEIKRKKVAHVKV